MADNIIQRRMDAEEEANKEIAAQDFQHTLGAPLSSGAYIHRDLLERAQERQHMIDALGEGSQFLDYKRSQVGGIGKDREIHRQLTQLSRQERKKREARFGKHKRPLPSRHKKPNSDDKRQAFNATGDADEVTRTYKPNDRQDYNSDDNTRGLNITFREPNARGYDPFK